jgi:hypothetical protein
MGKRQHDPDKGTGFVRPITVAYSLKGAMFDLYSIHNTVFKIYSFGNPYAAAATVHHC